MTSVVQWPNMALEISQAALDGSKWTNKAIFWILAYDLGKSLML